MSYVTCTHCDASFNERVVPPHHWRGGPCPGTPSQVYRLEASTTRINGKNMSVTKWVCGPEDALAYMLGLRNAWEWYGVEARVTDTRGQIVTFIIEPLR